MKIIIFFIKFTIIYLIIKTENLIAKLKFFNKYMTLLFKVCDNLGHLILNYLDCEDLYTIVCGKYTSSILEKIKIKNNKYLLKNHLEEIK